MIAESVIGQKREETTTHAVATTDGRSPSRLASRLPAMAYRNFRRYSIGQGASVGGTWVQNVALSWLVLKLTDSGAAVGVVSAAQFVPPLLFGAWAGALADRFDARRAVLALQVLLDGAHNPDAARALALALHELPIAGRRVLIIGVLAGRDPAAMLGAIDATSFDEVITCTPPTARARPAHELADAAIALGCPTRAIEHIDDALVAALDGAADDDLILVTGSIYLVAEAREVLAH